MNDREDTKPDNLEYGIHHEPSLKECKRIAEWIINKDKENDIEIDMDMF